MILIVYTLVIISAILFSVAFWYALFLVLAPRRKTGPNYCQAVNKKLALVLVVAVALQSCQGRPTSEVKIEATPSSDAQAVIVDTVTLPPKLLQRWAFLDSNLKYARLADEMEKKMLRAEADYYQTNDEKYYKLFFKYRKKQWFYVGLNRRYYDSLNSK